MSHKEEGPLLSVGFTLYGPSQFCTSGVPHTFRIIGQNMPAASAVSVSETDGVATWGVATLVSSPALGPEASPKIIGASGTLSVFEFQSTPTRLAGGDGIVTITVTLSSRQVFLMLAPITI